MPASVTDLLCDLQFATLPFSASISLPTLWLLKSYILYIFDLISVGILDAATVWIIIKLQRVFHLQLIVYLINFQVKRKIKTLIMRDHVALFYNKRVLISVFCPYSKLWFRIPKMSLRVLLLLVFVLKCCVLLNRCCPPQSTTECWWLMKGVLSTVPRWLGYPYDVTVLQRNRLWCRKQRMRCEGLGEKEQRHHLLSLDSPPASPPPPQKSLIYQLTEVLWRGNTWCNCKALVWWGEVIFF